LPDEYIVARLPLRYGAHAFRLPKGAPGDGPPRILYLAFAIAGDGHGFPLRVRAPQRFVSNFRSEPPVAAATGYFAWPGHIGNELNLRHG